MMLAPLRNNATRRQTSTVAVVPAPFGGWNARDDITDMKPEEAIVLDNYIPDDSSVRSRDGYTSWATGIGGAVQSLFEYAATDGTNKMFAAKSTAIYNVTPSGAVGAADLSSLSNGNWIHTMFATAGGSYLVIANGADSVRNYSGSAWSTPSITGVTSSNLATVTAHQSRLWFCEVGTLKVWYLGTLAISGAATAIDFAGLSRLGGQLMAMGSWTRDSGSGIEDLAVFITSKGEVHIYSGSDPSSATTWSRVGTFKIPEPIGRNCIIKVGGDLGILTSQGLVPLSGVLAKTESTQGRVALTDMIRDAFTSAYNSAATTRGWQVTEYPVGKLLVINVPVIEDTEAVQFVLNANTGKWCKFTGINAGCWSLMGTRLFFGGADGTVYRYGGSNDNGATITAKAVSAFSTFGNQLSKNLRRILPRFFGPTGYRPQVGFRFDFSEDETLSPSSTVPTGGSPWDESPWDTSPWAPADTTNAQWQSASGYGTTIAVAIQTSLTEPISYHGCKLEMEIGDHL